MVSLGSNSSAAPSFRWIPWLLARRPVSRLARLGPQTGVGTKLLVKTTPSSARALTVGMAESVSQRWSSV